jgi:polyribonucleotide nucleotidyltransferase
MDAGVPLIRPVAGIAMGLILDDEGKFAVLSDILGDEDHLGDMDFKVAGTDQGITSLQMDIKIAGITEEIMKVALAQATEGRNHILAEMGKAIDGARDGVRDGAPRITQLTVKKDKIRDIIGTGGKVIREICETTGAKIDIDDDGKALGAPAVLPITVFPVKVEDGNVYVQLVEAKKPPANPFAIPGVNINI